MSTPIEPDWKDLYDRTAALYNKEAEHSKNLQNRLNVATKHDRRFTAACLLVRAEQCDQEALADDRWAEEHEAKAPEIEEDSK